MLPSLPRPPLDASACAYTRAAAVSHTFVRSLSPDMPSFEIAAVVRGYHVYKDIWDPSIGEELVCARDPTNPRDPFAVAVVKFHQTVGHVPLKISSLCSMFLRHGGTIMCKITGRRQYTRDLAQGGLEIPCTLRFEGCLKDITKVERLVRKSLATSTGEKELSDDHPSEQSSEDEPPRKKTRCEDVDIEAICNGEKLTDLHVGFAQKLLKQQFPHCNGLQPTVFQAKKTLESHKPLPNQLQVIHSRGNHWILASNIGCGNGEVSVYDSVYSSVDKATMAIITHLFQSSKVKIVKSPKQMGGSDCGVFVIAMATALAHGILNVSSFNQSAMRPHLVNCFEELMMTPFPCT